MNLWAGDVVGKAGAAQVGVRPEHLRIEEPGTGKLDGEVLSLEQTGSDVLVKMRMGDHQALALVPRGREPDIGATVGLDFEDRHQHLFAADGAALV
jgi:ABC-type sugar transport system ATPase subunit